MDFLKSQIILKDGIYYFDWTASGLGLKSVENEMQNVLQNYSNTHSECGANAKATSELYEFSRNKIKEYLELGDDFYLLGCGFGSTAAIKKFWELMGIYIPPMTKNALFSDEEWQERLKAAPLVITGPFEHHSNELCLRYLFCEHKRIGLDKNNLFDYDNFELFLKNEVSKNPNRRVFINISAASNVTGIKVDTAKIRQIQRKIAPKAIITLDASSLIAHENIPSSHFDALFISPHKLLGGPGSCGLLAIRKSLVKADIPTFAGGGVVEYVSRSSARFTKDFERLEEAGTPPILELIKAYLALKERNNFGLDEIRKKEQALMQYFEAGLEKIPHIINYCPKNCDRVAIYAFNCSLVGCYDFAKILSEKYSVAVRAGCSCAGPYGHDILGLEDDFEPYFKPGWVRVSLHYSQDFSDIDYLLSAINSCVKHFC